MCFVHFAEEEYPFYQCPRFLLAKVLARAREEGDPDFLFGGKIELSLLNDELEAVQGIDVIEIW